MDRLVGRSFFARALVGGLLLWPLTAAQAESPPAGVKAVLELSQPFYYAGDPFAVKLTIGNDGDREVPNPVKSSLFGSFEAKTVEGAPLKAQGKPGAAEPERPSKLPPGSHYGAIVDLTQIFPDLKKPGRYEIRWAADGVSSNAILVQLLPRYDPAKTYRARVETDEGSFVIEFFRDTAPIATKAFVDLANAGFYDGLVFYEVRPDWLVASGDPNGDGTGSAPFRYPAELTSAVPVVAGTVVLRPVSAAPPANSSQFMIMLKPQPEMKGQVTVLGQVVDGLETVQRISRLPSTQQAERPYYKPLKDVRIRKVAILEREKGPGSEG